MNKKDTDTAYKPSEMEKLYEVCYRYVKHMEYTFVGLHFH